MTQGVYIIHAEQKVAHAQHYVGWSEDVEARFEKHLKSKWIPLEAPIVIDDTHKICGKLKGRGCRLLAFMNYKGIRYQIAKVFVGRDRNFEKKLKDTNNTPIYCPICNPHAKDYTPRG